MRSKSLPDLPFRLPIKIDTVSNGEFVPEPLDARLRWVVNTARERIDRASGRSALSRREFLRSSCAAATVLLALNETACGGGGYALPKEAGTEPDAARKLEGSEFVFDVQTHHVSPERPWWKLERPTMATFLKTTGKAKSCSNHWTECFARDAYLKEIFLDSDTSMAVLSALWGTDDINAITVEEMALTRERMAKTAGAPRLRIHGVVLPKSEPREKSAARMQRTAESLDISAWKLYPVWSSDNKGYRLDDPETGLWTLREGVRLGIPLFAVHKGFPLPGAENAFSSPIDVGPAAKAVPEATILVYHSGCDLSKKEGPYDPKAETGVDALIRGVKESGIGKDGNVYAELGSIWRVMMKDPDQAAHVLGKLLVHLGEDRILWGTDSIWYGSPQDQIQAFRAFQIGKEYQERYGYPELTPAIKAKILGLNAARVYRVDVDEVRRAQKKDAVSQARLEYQNDPRPSFDTYGPRTRRELASLLRAFGPFG